MASNSKAIKQAVTEAMFDKLQAYLYLRLADDPRTCQSAIEVHHVSEFQRSVRVKTPSSGTYYFLIRVSEQM